MIELQELTPPQDKLMRFIGQYWQQNQGMPTFVEMAKSCDYTSISPVQLGQQEPHTYPLREV